MKKAIFLIIGLSAITGLTILALSLNKNAGKSDSELIDFAIKDVESVDKVIITDKFQVEYTLLKKGDQWTDKEGRCITQEKVGWVLDAFKNIEFKAYMAENSKTSMTNLMASQHIKVEIFQDGEWTKTWYLGPSSQDHLGQIMLLDSKEYGKSDNPVIMKIKNVKGIIDARFYSDPRKWMCTNIFEIPLKEISYVQVTHLDEPARSFKVTKKGGEMHVYQQFEEIKNVDSKDIYKYLNNYQKIHFDVPNYELNDKEIDSLKKTKPFCELIVKETNNNTTKLRMFRIVNQQNEMAGMAEVQDIDLNRFWCELPNGEMVKCQYFVFNPLILGHAYFDMDLSSVKTHDGLQPIEQDK